MLKQERTHTYTHKHARILSYEGKFQKSIFLTLATVSQVRFTDNALPRPFTVVSKTSGENLLGYVFWTLALPSRLSLQPPLFFLEFPLLVLGLPLLILAFMGRGICGNVQRNVPRLESSIRRHEDARESCREHVAPWDWSGSHEGKSFKLELYHADI